MIIAAAGCDSTCDFGTGSTEYALLDMWRDLEPRMRRVALRFAENPDQVDDLVQEALIELWLIDPSRFLLHDPQDAAYLRRMLVRRMWDVRRAEVHIGRDCGSGADDAADGAEP